MVKNGLLLLLPQPQPLNTIIQFSKGLVLQPNVCEQMFGNGLVHIVVLLGQFEAQDWITLKIWAGIQLEYRIRCKRYSVNFAPIFRSWYEPHNHTHGKGRKNEKPSVDVLNQTILVLIKIKLARDVKFQVVTVCFRKQSSAGKDIWDYFSIFSVA